MILVRNDLYPFMVSMTSTPLVRMKGNLKRVFGLKITFKPLKALEIVWLIYSTTTFLSESPSEARLVEYTVEASGLVPSLLESYYFIAFSPSSISLKNILFMPSRSDESKSGNYYFILLFK